MKQNKEFVLKSIESEFFLFPIGQAVANRMAPLKLNETGAEIWNYIETEKSTEDIYRHLREVFSDDKSRILKDDVIDFLDLMYSKGYVKDFDREKEDLIAIIKSKKYYKIGESCFSVCLLDNISVCIPEEIESFAIEGALSSQDMCTVFIGNIVDRCTEEASLLVRTEDIMVCKNDYGYLFSYLQHKLVRYLEISNDVKQVKISVRPSEKNECIQEELMRALRTVVGLCELKNEHIFVHSASVLYKNRLWLFSGPSGAGKSTHAKLWESYSDAGIVNGDINLIGCIDEDVLAWGSPWCGTSKKYDTNTYPVGGIFFIKKDEEDYVKTMAADEKIASLMARIINIPMNAKYLEGHLNIASDIAQRIEIAELHCTKNESAFRVMKKYIDSIL